MDKLISESAFYEAVYKLPIHREQADGDNYYYFVLIADIFKMLEQLPPAQPEIIRCKDCKHWIPYDWMFSEVWQSKNMADYPEDEIGCNYCDMTMKANDFCSRGERREVTT